MNYKRITLFIVLIAAFVLLLGTGSVFAAEPGDIIVNEIMNNPAAVSDGSGEWFEVHNTTGADIDIDGWTIRDDGSDSHVIDNGGPLLVPAGGFLILGNNSDSGTNGGVTVDYDYNGNWFLSNGADEVILEDTANVEINRVEYDGGPNFPDLTGASMSLIDPALDNNVGANWCEASTPYGAGDLGTPGAGNDCPTGPQPPQPGDVIVNEIMNNPLAVNDGDGEWFEVFNTTDSDIDIDGWTMRDDDSDSHVISNGGPLLVPANGHLVLGNNDDSATNGGAPVAYNYGSSWFLSNGADEVILEAGGVEIDRVEYDGGPLFPDPTGASMSLIDPALDNNDGMNWCEASTPYGDGDLGTPGGANDCPGGTDPDTVIVNEIMNNPSAVFDNDGEWFEVHNSTAGDIDINGWTIADNDSDSHVIDNGGPLVVPAGGFLVLGNNADMATNGGAPVAYSYGTDMFLSNSADEVVLFDETLAEINRVEYDGGPNFPDPTGASMALEDPALDNNVGANWCEASTPYGDGDLGTPGGTNDCDSGPDPLAVFIHEVQGSGDSVVITDLVIVEAIVVGDYQAGNELDGFFIQEEDADADADPNTSEGIFVFCEPCAVPVTVGDKVQVTGFPEEFFNMSQIDAAGPDGLVAVVGTDVLPTASIVNLPAGGSTVAELTFENVEGMLVTFPETLVVSEYFQLARFGQLVLTKDARPHQFTDTNAPSEVGNTAFLDELSTRRIILDDNTNWQNPSLGSPDTPYYWPRPGLSNGNFIRGGDSIVGLTGAMHWSWAGSGGTDAWRIRPVNEAFAYDFTPNIERPAAPEDVGGTFKVAAFNVLNYFKTIDNGVNTCGPAADGCRGAHSERELMRQRDKIVAAMVAMDADVLGLVELENDTGASIADLVDGLNAAAGAGSYDFVDTGYVGDDAIKVGFIYKVATANPVGGFAVLDSTVDPTFNDDKNRAALAQTFAEVATGGRFTAVVNHLKSKGSSCDDVGDPNMNDGQGNCNQTRTDAAIALANWLATDPTGSGDPDFMILGDLNAYRMEDPISALEAAGYTDLLDALLGPDAYTYVFDGQLGYLDYALSNPSLTSQVTGVTGWNINADEIPLFDYNDEIQDPAEASFERESDALPIYEISPFRASDHDPVLVGLALNGPPVCTTATPSPATLWPPNHRFVPINILGVTDPDGDAFTITIDSIFQDEVVSVPGGTGSGKSSPDGRGLGTDTAEVRAERAGSGDGRFYHISFTAEDSQGNSCSGLVNVTVARNKSGTPPIDGGPLFDSTVEP